MQKSLQFQCQRGSPVRVRNSTILIVQVDDYVDGVELPFAMPHSGFIHGNGFVNGLVRVNPER
jgi:hypothetical protein